jgi:hypothetical protein
MVKTLLKNKAVKSLLWAAPVGLMMVSGGQAMANTILLDSFDSLQGVSNNPLGAPSATSLEDMTVVGGEREMVIVSPGVGGDPSVSLTSDFPLDGRLNYDSGGSVDEIATTIVRWDGDQDPNDTALNFDLGGFDATGMGMNNAFIWEGFNLDVANGATDPTLLKMRAYSGTDATDFASELILELTDDTIADLLIFNFADFSNFGMAASGADFTALTAIEFEIMAPGTTDVSLDLLESGDSNGNPSGPQDVPEPGMVMAMATLGLTGLLAKRKKVN